MTQKYCYYGYNCSAKAIHEMPQEMINALDYVKKGDVVELPADMGLHDVLEELVARFEQKYPTFFLVDGALEML